MNIKDKEIYTGYMYSYPHKTAYRKIKPLNIGDYGHTFSGGDNSLYIHIPFCKAKCGYCNLFSITGMSEEYFDKYVYALENHAHQLSSLNISFSSLIIGGGTPLILNNEQLKRLFNISKILNIDLQETFTCVETSPNDTTEEKAEALAKNHVNRVSIGVQSFIDSELKSLNRIHNVASINKALNILNGVGFPTINIDIIYGIPSQTKETLKHSLEQAIYYCPEEIFLYPLYIRKNSHIAEDAYNEPPIKPCVAEPNHSLKKNDCTAKFKETFYWCCNNDKYELYLFARDFLLTRGYIQASMRRFSKVAPKPTSCGFGNTISLGAGGRSYIGNIHTCLPYSNIRGKCLNIIDEYIKSENKLIMDYGYILNADEQKRRYVIKNLLTVNGINRAEYFQAFNSSLLDDFRILHDFSEKGYLIITLDKAVLTPLGLSLSDYIGPMLISNDVKNKMEEWDFDDL